MLMESNKLESHITVSPPVLKIVYFTRIIAGTPHYFNHIQDPLFVHSALEQNPLLSSTEVKRRGVLRYLTHLAA